MGKLGYSLVLSPTCRRYWLEDENNLESIGLLVSLQAVVLADHCLGHREYGIHAGRSPGNASRYQRGSAAG